MVTLLQITPNTFAARSVLCELRSRLQSLLDSSILETGISVQWGQKLLQKWMRGLPAFIRAWKLPATGSCSVPERFSQKWRGT
jgi:hypothetical protein